MPRTWIAPDCVRANTIRLVLPRKTPKRILMRRMVEVIEPKNNQLIFLKSISVNSKKQSVGG